MADLVIRGGTVLTDRGLLHADVGITDGRIEAIGEAVGGDRTIDAKGAWVGPGFVDLHTHLREPGQTWKEDIASGSASAAAGGYTAVVAMPNTVPALDTPELTEAVKARGDEVGLVEVVPSGCLTVGRAGGKTAPIAALAASGVKLFSDDGDSVDSAALLLEAMSEVAAVGGVVSQHAVDGPLSAAGVMHEGSASRSASLPGIPVEAEEMVVARDLALAFDAGVRYHVQHVSSERVVTLIRAAKMDGASVTCEVTPHHLMFTDEWVLAGGANFKMMPPLRSEEDRKALREALLDGTIDAVATDHAPHAPHEKEGPLANTPNGVLGLEWAASSFLTTCNPSPDVFFDRMSVSPARIAGIEGQGLPLREGGLAHIVVFDPSATWIPTESRSKSRNAPYLGMELAGFVRATVYAGKLTHGYAA